MFHYYRKLESIYYFRSATGENWQQIMMSCTSAKCDPRSESTQSDCGSFFAYIYFVAFYMICSFLVSAVLVIYNYEHFPAAFLPASFTCILN